MNSVNSSDSSNVYSSKILNNIDKATKTNPGKSKSAERKVYIDILNYLQNDVNQSNSLNETIKHLNHIIDRSTGFGKLNKTMADTFKQAISKVKDIQEENPTEANDTESTGSQNSLSAEESQILLEIEQSYIDFPKNEGKRMIYYMQQFIEKLNAQRGNMKEFEKVQTHVKAKLEEATTNVKAKLKEATTKEKKITFDQLFVAFPRLQRLMQLSTPDSMHEASWLLEKIEMIIDEYLNQDSDLPAVSPSEAKKVLQNLQEVFKPVLEMARPKTSE